MNFAETLEPRRLLSGLTDAVTVDGTPTGENDVILGQTSNAVIFAHDNPRYGYEPTIFRGKDQISVIDANPGAGGSNPKPFAQAGNVLFFTTESHDARLLWRTDGVSSNRTSRVHIDTSTPPVVAGKYLYFFGALEQNEHALWRAELSTGDTKLVKNFNEEPSGLIAFRDSLYFAAHDSNVGTELWRSDGTGAGTQLFADLAGFSFSSNPHSFVATTDQLFFLDRPDNGKNNQHLWATDGQLTSMITTAGQDAISDLTARGDLLYFIERDAKLGVDSLWRTNGLSGGLKRLRNFNDRAKIVQKDPNSGVTGRIFVDQINAAGSSRALFAVKDDTVTAITRPGPENFPTARQMGNRLYFSRAVSGGQQLWISDGTFAGTRNRESFTGTQFIGGFTTFNSRVAFVISDSPSYDGAAPIPRTSTLCVTIGLADGVVALKFINTGRTLTLAGALLRGTRLYFTVPDPIAGDDLWFTDGTRPGTTGALSSGFNPQHFSVVKGGMYFSAKNSIWFRSDATDRITQVISGAGELDFVSPLDGVNIITSYGRIWRSDNTRAGTKLLYDDGDANTFRDPHAVGKYLVFSRGIDNGFYRTDGTVAGTGVVNYQISMDHAITVGNQLLFSRSISNALYVTNGKGSGTQAINPPMDVQSDFININGSAYFFADEQLWKSDGSAAGKKLVHDDIAGTGFTRFKGAIYFTAGHGLKSLWTTDGTEAGTKVISVGVGGDIIPADDFFYILSHKDDGTRLWKSDGTAKGTAMLAAIPQHFDFFLEHDFATVIGDRLYFSASDEDGMELWTSTGTAKATVLLKDINPGPGGSIDFPRDDFHFTPFPVLATPAATTDGINFYFAADDGVHGRELWKTDATPTGTKLVKDILPGGSGSKPTQLIDHDGVVFFSAESPDVGRELWQLPLA